MKGNFNIMVISAVLLTLQACSVKKFIPEGERLYTGAEVEIKADSVIKNEAQLKSVLEEALRPEPNSKFLGMRPGLYYYYKMQQEKPGFINRFLYKRIGEEPVYQSDVKPYEVEEILVNRMENRGFFYSEATSEFEEKEQEASVKYSVTAPSPYTIASYQVDTLQEPIFTAIQQSVANTKLTKGMRFDLSNMKLERERIDNDLKKIGYYNFNSGFLLFEADTNQYDKRRFDLFLRLKNETPAKSKVPYQIKKINVYAKYDAQDSTITDVVRFNEKNFVNSDHFFKPKYLDPYITLEEDQYYNPETSRNTARRLSSIGAYKFVNIQYSEIDSLRNDTLGILEANIFLSPLNKRAIRAELQAVSKSNNFAGPGLALTYSNRNLFLGGETLNISANVGYEVQAGGSTESNSGKTSLDLGFKTELIFPRVLFPIKINTDFFEYDIPKTKTSLGIDYLSRTKLYALLSATAQFGYIWQANRYVTHEIIPISINYTNLSNTTPEFEEILEENPFLKRSFEQQFISGLNYSFTYNGMIDTAKKNQFFVNATLDVAGNSISLFGKENEMGSKSFLKLEYAQYAKADADLRYHFNFGKEQVIAMRLFGGYGLPYGNSDVMPYVKQYYSGGPYSVRAFRIRSLGPGTYNDEDNPQNNFYDQTGNIRLEANIEYRFPIISFLKGAVFADAGNIWNSKANPEYDSQDKFTSNFINELGMGAGVGLRVDVQGFVLRFDFAAPFHDPAEPKSYNFNVKETVFNFGIGYPF
ncbi:BamA/TamA family outer membrane protein [Aequorivita sp. SDUM287046]|uniref:BamA/TamA family outer membrane protein n=1 Tax=Aequorivita aurantiaca TaxID=3053356 RepID=A0ABT8DE75_9FLAO|nr:BamA/TamA family outer membrane protein [Aequorivita aurantiaca]MDN3723581.1 BamA/TamA family outer membrane protein [Aequorivita aurantiaca]